MTVSPLVLVLPLPASLLNTRDANRYMATRRKNEYKAACWASAIQQAMPKADVDLPEHVQLNVCFYVRNLRDEDALGASLKWVLDALKQTQPEGDDLHWRQQCYTEKGYFLNDDPLHCTVDKPEQRIDRAEPRLVLAIYANEGRQAA